MPKNKGIVGKLKMMPISKQLIGWVSVGVAFVTALGILYGVEVGAFISGIVLFGLGLVLVIETRYEKKNIIGLGDIIMITFGALSMGVGILTAGNIVLPEPFQGFIASITILLYFVLAIATVYEMYR